MNIHKLFAFLSPYFRSKRSRLFLKLMQPAAGQTILDVGGYHWFWLPMKLPNPITCLNLHIPALTPDIPPQYTYIQGDGRNLPVPDLAYDIVFSNSVVEHLGKFEDQQRFASEIRRAGRSYWVQTPNYWFPIEPHLITPFVHYWPISFQRYMLRWFTIWGLITRPSQSQINDLLKEIRLLTVHEMKELFPEANILIESFLGMPKSIIAWHN